ncbi:MAG: hypothetical protein AAGC77_07970, partial [Pseudomonadota bacterium]
MSAIALLAACASDNDESPRYVNNLGAGINLTELADAALPKGKCGMILWTLESDNPVAILRYVAGETAEIALNGAQETLALSEISGSSNFGVFENQSFSNETGLAVDVKVRFGLGFDGGAYLERGLITVDNDDGWRVVAPTAGIAGWSRTGSCRRTSTSTPR